MKKIVFIATCLVLFAFGNAGAQAEIHVFADGFSNEIFNGDPATLAQETDFGTLAEGSPDSAHYFTIVNWSFSDDLSLNSASVTSGMNFTIDFMPEVLPPGIPTILTVTFQTSTAPIGVYDATVTIESNDPNSPFTFAVRAEVTGTPPPLFPDINLQGNGMDIDDGEDIPSNLDGTYFGSITLGDAPVVRTFTIQNTGDELLNVTNINLSGTGLAAFTLGALDPVSPVATSEYAEFTVTFNPATTGVFDATIEIENDDPDEDPYTFAITGEAIMAPVSDVEVRGNSLVIANGDNTPSTADGTDFGITPPFQGHPINHFFVITNTGADPLNVASIYLTQSGTEYEITSPLTPASPIPPGNSASFTVSFVTNTNGPLDATVTIDSDEPDYTFLVRGSGETPAAQDIYVAGGLNLEIINGDTSPNTQDGTDLGPITVGSSTNSTIILDNFGSAVLHVTDIAVSGTHQLDFTVGAMTPIGMLVPGEIPFGNGTTFPINFNPSATGLRQATITITSDDPDESPYVFNVQGTGTPMLSTWYEDADGDSYGNPAVSQMAASQPSGYVANSTDCDDTNNAINPGAMEVCNGVDDDCDGSTDEGVQTTFYADSDGDGFGNPAVTQAACSAPMGYVANSTDCDDTNNAIFPGATEVCNGIDDDCDGDIDESGAAATWYADSDDDTYGDPLVSQISCTQPMGYVANSTDCDDTNNAVNPAATEVCNGIDDDCDGSTDEGVQLTFYADTDGDTYGDPLVSQMACSAPMGYVANDDDCDDTNNAIFPGATEVCNGVDDDCDGSTDEGVQLTFYADTDGDTYGDPLVSQISCTQPMGYVVNSTDCDDTNNAINPGAMEVCNGVDDDCDGSTDEGVQTTFYADSDGDGFGNLAVTQAACSALMGYVANNTDCDDTNNAIFPGTTEVCNGVDDDCDGSTDEGVQMTFYADTDGDTYGDPLVSQMACSAPMGYVANDDDCDDANNAVNPAATEVCNGIDDDCDGSTDEGVQLTFYADTDGDTYGDPLVSQMACSAPMGYVANSTDCDDTNNAIFPGATEVCNGIDDDCDGDIDESGAAATWYVDSDGDTYGDPLVSQISCTQPMGYVANSTDCDDTNNTVNPAAMEVCNGFDDNCANGVDEGLLSTYYLDFDSDTYGDPAQTQTACTLPPGYVTNGDDCDDTNNDVNPAATEVCNGVDDDCNTLSDTADPGLSDNELPTVSCQNITVQLGTNGTVSINATQVSAGASDNCGTPTLSISPSSFTCSNFGANTVTLTATDFVGNTATCTATITVEDNTPPTALCKNITATLDAAGNASITAFQVDNGSFDNCAVGPISIDQSSFDCTDLGANTVTLTVPDVFGNMSTCTATVTVLDNTPPTVSCQNTTAQLNASGTATIQPNDVITGLSDNCGTVSGSLNTANFNCTNIGANTVIVTATDGSNNTATCSVTVTIVDNAPPTVDCQNITVPLDAFGNAIITPSEVSVGAFDNCGTPTLSLNNINFSCANIGANTVVLTATDGSNNTATCSATVTIVDNAPPTVNCQNIIVPLNAAGTATITPAQVSAGASDNCGAPTLSLNITNLSCANIGANTVVLTATAGSLTATCSATVTIVDNTPPTAICQNLTVALDANGTASIAPAQVNNGSSDACGLGSLSLNQSSFNCGNIGANTVTLSVPDANGNTATCTATITVQDLIPPSAACQNITVTLGANGTVSITPAQVNNGSSDNCGTPSLSLNISSFGCANIGANTVTLTATDAGGSTSTCFATVAVQDNTPPTALCKNAIVALDANGSASISTSDVNNGSFDNCVSPVLLSLSQSSFNCSNIGTNTVVLTVTAGSQSSNCTAIVTVQDNTPPTVNCQDITVPLDAFGNAVITPAQVSAGASDNCGAPTLSLNISSFSCANIGANTVVLTATAGNLTATCSAMVTIIDNLPPTANCQNVTAPLNTSGTATITPAEVNNGSSDNCALGSLSLSQSSFSCANIGTPVSVALSVPDVNGNTATCSATVTVIDNLPPTAICQSIIISLDVNGTASIAPGDVNNGSFDNCGAPTLSLSQSSFNCSNLGLNNVTLTATDASGNSSTCAATVTVNSILTVNAGTDVSLCSGNNTQLYATASGAASYTYSWSPTTGLSNANIADPVASPSSTTTYTITISANGCPATDQVTVSVAPAPIAAISTNSPVCEGSTIALSETGSSPGITWAWSGPNNFSSTLQNPTISNASALNAGQYSVTVSNGSSCSATATTTISVDGLPTANAGTDQSICAGATAQLQATGGTAFLWSPAASLSDPAIANPVASPSATTTYTVTVTNGNNCTATDAVVVTVAPQPTISGVLANCDANMNNYTVNLNTNASQLLASAGTVTNNGGGAWTVSGVPTGTNLTLTATDGGGCSATQQVTSPNCSCPAVGAPVAVGNTNAEICEGLSNPGFAVTVGAGETADWYDAATGGTLVASGVLSFTPSQSAPGIYNFYAETRVIANGCLSTVRTHFSLAILQNPVANAGNDVNICAGVSVQLNGTASNSANGALTYAWSPAASLNDPSLMNPTASPGLPTTYALTVTDPKGCTDEATVSLNISTVSPPTAGANQAICAGATLPALTVSVNAGETADWYSAAIGGALLAQGSTSYTPTAAGTFHVESRLLAGGCTSANRAPISLTINTLPIASATAGIPVCVGSNVQLDASTSLGAAPLSFAWNNGATIANPTVTPTSTTTYTVIVTDGNGCSATAQTTATVNANPSLTLGTPACDANLINYSFTVSLSGGDQLATTAGTITGGGTSYSVTAPSGQNLQLTAINSFTGCTTQQNVTGLVCGCPTALAPVSGGDKVICEGTPTPTLSVNVGANQTADWYTQPVGGIAAATSTTSFTPSQTTPGIYTFYVETRYTLNNSCLSATRTPIQLVINALPTANAGLDATICESETITLNGTGSGTGSLSYAWSPAVLLSNATIANPDFAAAAVGLQPFTLTVTDANGCSATDAVDVNVVAKPSLLINSPTCNGLSYSVTFTTNANQVAATAGVLVGIVGTFTITDIPSLTDVTITVTNPTTGCSEQQTVSGIACNCAGLVGAPVSGGNQAACAGATIPALTVTVGTGATANWYDSAMGGSLLAANTTSYTATGAGTYYAEAVNATLGCVSDIRTPLVLSINPLPTAVITPNGATTFCEGNTVDLTASGGTVFLWGTGETSATIAASTSNNYAVTVTGTGGCTATASQNVTVNPNPAAAITGDNDLCLGENTVLTASGGTGYSWSTGALIAATTVSPTADATYSVTVTGAGGCTATVSQNVTVHALPVANAGTDAVFCTNTNGVQLNASGTGQGPFSFVWSPTAGLNDPNTANPVANPTSAGNYSVTVSDANGCSSSDEVAVSLQDAPVLDVLSNSPICVNEDLNLSETGGQAVQWTWMGPGGFSSNEQNPVLTQADVLAGSYSLVANDANGCSSTADLEVELSAGLAFEAKFLTTNVACEGDTLHFIEISATTELPDAFIWDFGDGITSTERDPAHVYEVAGAYQVSVVVTEGGCDNFSIEKEISINDCRSNGNTDGIVFYKISPNVTDGKFRLQVELADRGLLQLELVDMGGRARERRSLRDILSFDEEFTLQEPGVYFMHIRTLLGQKALKVVVVRA